METSLPLQKKKDCIFRIKDKSTNIQTHKLFSHRNRSFIHSFITIYKAMPNQRRWSSR